jgi:hypothetical protein
MLGTPRRAAASAAAIYAVCALVYFAAPLFRYSGGHYVGNGYDPQIFIWSFAWWPHAILHGENPFITHAVWAPDGVNLTWTTAVPGLALLFAPLTLLFGAAASYDVAAVLMPALAAWTAYLLCRYLTRSFWPAFVGGYLFGFSSYVLATAWGGHLNLSSVFLLPLIALVLLRYLDGALGGGGLVLRLAPMLALEVLFSSEIAFTATLAILCALVLAAAFVPARRPRIGALLLPLLGAYAAAAILISPFLYYLLTGFHESGISDPDSYNADVVNFVVPTRLIALGSEAVTRITDRFPGNRAEQGAYVGLPALAIVVLYARERLRTGTGRFLIVALVLAAVAALGVEATAAGDALVSFPWKLVHSLPLFDRVLTTRLTVYVALVVAIVAALWTAARRRGRLRIWLPALALLALVPDPAVSGFATPYSVPAFFTAAAYRNCLASGEIVLPLPIREGGDALLWQVARNFRFDLAGGEIGPAIPPSFLTPGAMAYVTAGRPVSPRRARILRTFTRAKHVTSVVVDGAQSGSWSGALDRIATPPTRSGFAIRSSP